MTPEVLLALIEAGETMDVEFKGEEKKPLSDGDLLAAVVCLANRPGSAAGWLLVGVENDGRVAGARPRHEAGITDPRRVQALIAGRTRPSLSCRVELVPIREGEVLAIEVFPARAPVATSDGAFYRRAIGHRGQPECLPMFFHEMQALQADRGALDYSALTVAEAAWSDLDPLEFERFRRSIRETGRGDRSLLELADFELTKALGAVTGGSSPETIRVLALLLFGREESLRRLLPTHEAAFQVLAGSKVEVNDFFRWPLVRLVEELETRLRARHREEELMVGMFRVGVPDYSPAAFREAVANALVHRDYTRLGAVHVQWHHDRVVISNPGGFPEGISLDNLLVAGPRPRNPLLADAFKRAGIVERTGRGIDTIFEEQLRNGRPAPSYGRSTATDVALELPGGEANLSFVRLLVEESQAGRLLTFVELRSSTACGWSAHSRRRRPPASRSARSRRPAAPSNVWSRQASSSHGARRRPASTTCPPRPTAASARRPHTCAAAASSRSSRSRWCCNTSKNTAASSAPRSWNSARSVLSRQRASLCDLRRQVSYWLADRRRGPGMNAVRIYDRDHKSYDYDHKYAHPTPKQRLLGAPSGPRLSPGRGHQ